jgi:fructose-specific phosphotransferase system component IIB
MTTFTTEDRLDAEKLTQATVVITAKGNEVEVHTEGEGQALFIANLMVQLVDQKVKGTIDDLLKNMINNPLNRYHRNV